MVCKCIITMICKEHYRNLLAKRSLLSYRTGIRRITMQIEASSFRLSHDAMSMLLNMSVKVTIHC